MKACWELGVFFLNFGIEVSGQLHTSSALPSENYLPYPLNMKLSGSQCSFWRIVADKILSGGGNRTTGWTLKSHESYPAFCGTQRFISVFSRSFHLTVFPARWIKSTPSHPLKWRSIMMFFPTCAELFQVIRLLGLYRFNRRTIKMITDVKFLALFMLIRR